MVIIKEAQFSGIDWIVSTNSTFIWYKCSNSWETFFCHLRNYNKDYLPFFFFITFESPLSSHWFRKPVRSIFCPQTKLPYLFYLNKSKICFLFYYEALKYWARSFQLSFNKFLGVFVFFVLFCCLFWLSWFEIKCCACDISEFAKLVEEFRSFGVKLMQSSSGLSHGTFEWVDSMLVRALKSGDWLLMDNVNFCK